MPENERVSSTRWGPIAGLLLWTLLVRFFYLGRTGVWLDEAFSIYYASQPLGWLLENSAGLINHPPVYFLALKAWMIPFGKTIGSLEALSVLISAVTVVLFYVLVRRSLANRSAVGLSVLLSVHPFFLYYSLELRMYGLALTGLIGVAICSVRLFEASNRNHWFGLVFFSLLALYSHSLTFLYLVPAWIVLGLVRYRNHGTFKTYLVSLGTIGLLYCPWAYFVVRQALRIKSEFWIPPLQVADVAQLLLGWGGYTLPHDPGVLYVLSVSGLVMFFLVPLFFAFEWPLSDRHGLYWSLVLVPFVVLVGTSMIGQSVFLLRGFLFALPFVIVLWWTGVRRFPRRMKLGFFVLFLGFLLMNAVRFYRQPPHRYLNELAEIVKTRYPEATRLVHTSKRTFFPFQIHYYDEGTNQLLSGDLRPFFPGWWTTGLRNLERETGRSPLLFIVNEDRYHQWRRLKNRLNDNAKLIHRTRRWGKRTFHLFYLPGGFSSGTDGLALYRLTTDERGDGFYVFG